MFRSLKIVAIAFCLGSICTHAEEHPGQLLSVTTSTTIAGHIDHGVAVDPSLNVVSVRAVRRLFLIGTNSPPNGQLLVSFAIRRTGDTNNALIVDFELGGTAEVDVDYSRVLLASDVGVVANGPWQNVIFAPGETFRYVHFSIANDADPERSEFIRLAIPPPLQNGIVPPQYRVSSRQCATIWIVRRNHCIRSVPAPDGNQICVESRPVALPRAFFTTARCRVSGAAVPLLLP